MGRILLVRRLAARDLRRRPAQAVLLLIVITPRWLPSRSVSSCTA